MTTDRMMSTKDREQLRDRYMIQTGRRTLDEAEYGDWLEQALHAEEEQLAEYKKQYATLQDDITAFERELAKAKDESLKWGIKAEGAERELLFAKGNFEKELSQAKAEVENWQKMAQSFVGQSMSADTFKDEPHTPEIFGLYVTNLNEQLTRLRQEKVKLIRIAGRLGAEPCRCDPVGSGKEYCNGGCSLRQQVKDAEEYHGVQAEQITLLTNDNVSLRQSLAEADEAIVDDWCLPITHICRHCKQRPVDGKHPSPSDCIVLKSQGRKKEEV